MSRQGTQLAANPHHLSLLESIGVVWGPFR